MKIRSTLIAICLSVLLALVPSALQQITNQPPLRWLVRQLEGQIAPSARVGTVSAPTTVASIVTTDEAAKGLSGSIGVPSATPTLLPTQPAAQNATPLASTPGLTATLAATEPLPEREASNPPLQVSTQMLTGTVELAQPVAPVVDSTPPTATPLPLPAESPTPLPDRADLEITQSAVPDPVQAGAILTFTIQLKNPGPGIAREVLIRDTLPNGLVFEGAASLRVSRGEEPQLLLEDNQLTGSVSALRVGGVITIVAPVRIRPNLAVPILFNEVTVSSTTPDEQLVNNLASLSVTLQGTLPPNQHNYLPMIYR